MSHVDTCLTESGAVRVLTGALRGSETDAVRHHLDGCELCGRLIGEAARDTGAEETSWIERIRPRVLLPGMLLAERYDIRRLLGIGAMGEVHEAEDRLLGEVVAVKTLNAKLTGSAEALARLKLEVATAHRVTHPNVCRIFDFGTDGGDEGQGRVVFLTMEYLPGTTLAAHLRQRGRLSPCDALPLLTQLASGLAAAHAAQVVHRDLKAENVMLVTSTRGSVRAVITDFGLAGSIFDGESGDFTGKGGFSGTLAYAAPERIAGSRATAASDVYSFGVLAYEVLTGRLSPGRLVVDLPDLSLRWRRFLSRAIHPDPKSRFADGSALVTALGGIGREDEKPIARRLRRAALLAGCLGVAAAAIVRTKAPRPVAPLIAEVRQLSSRDRGPTGQETPSPPSERYSAPVVGTFAGKVRSHPARRNPHGPSVGLSATTSTTPSLASLPGLKSGPAQDLVRDVHFQDPPPSSLDLVDPFRSSAPNQTAGK